MNDLTDQIFTIDGEPYLKLACKPGTTLYRVHIQFYMNEGDYVLRTRFVVNEALTYSIDDILFIMKNNTMGKDYFFTYGEAERECIRRNEAKHDS